MKLEDRLAGAIAGAGAALVLGQIPPFTVLPDEAITVPAGAILGGILGFSKVKKVLKL